MTTLSSLKTRLKQQLIRLTPGQLVVQITDRCNARCPQCAMRTTSNFKRYSLDRDEMFKIINSARSQGIKAISFTGGEPLLMVDDLCDYINRAGKNKIPFIRTGTNGFQFSSSHKPNFKDKVSRLAEKLSNTPLRNFWISLDSADPELHEQMRGFKGVFKGISKALPIFEEHGIYPSVNLGINRNLGGNLTRNLSKNDYSSGNAYENAVYNTYCQAFSKFYETAIDMGFTIVNACYPMSVDEGCMDLDPVYQASATDHVIKFTPTEKRMIFAALRDTIPKYRSSIRIFSPMASLNALVKELDGEDQATYPCQGGINYLFIDAKSGDTYPCGYRGKDNFGKLYSMNGSGQLNSKECRKCDWECFRDPSELAGPIIECFSAPHRLAKKLIQNPGHFRLWAKDLLYYRACDYFNGRKAPDYKKIAHF